MEKEANQLYRRHQMTGQARDEEEEEDRRHHGKEKQLESHRDCKVIPEEVVVTQHGLLFMKPKYNKYNQWRKQEEEY